MEITNIVGCHPAPLPTLFSARDCDLRGWLPVCLRTGLESKQDWMKERPARAFRGMRAVFMNRAFRSPIDSLKNWGFRLPISTHLTMI